MLISFDRSEKSLYRAMPKISLASHRVLPASENYFPLELVFLVCYTPVA